MTMQGLPPPAPYEIPRGWKSWSSGTKLAAVLGGIALLLIVGFVAAVVWGYHWLTSADDQIPTTVVLGEDAVAFANLHADVEDAGVASLLEFVGRAIQEAERAQQSQQLPDSLRFLSAFQADQATALQMLWPRTAMIAVLERADGVREVAAAMNPRAMGGLVKLTFRAMTGGLGNREDALETHAHGGLSIAEAPSGFYALSGTTVLFSTSLERMRAVLDRAAAGHTAADPPAFLREAARDLEATSDAHAVFDNRSDVVDDVLAGWAEQAMAEGRTPGAGAGDVPPPPRLFDEAALVGLGLDVVSEDRMRGRLLLECPDENAAGATLARMRMLQQALIERATARGMTLEFREQPSGNDLELVFELSGMADAIARQVERAASEHAAS